MMALQHYLLMANPEMVALCGKETALALPIRALVEMGSQMIFG